MPHLSYRGETNSKSLTRQFVWWQHDRLLQADYKVTPHVFLSSKTGKDAEFLRSQGLKPSNVWAVESDPEQYAPLIELKRKLKFTLFTHLVESVVERHAERASLRSLYLDYCGTVEGTRGTTRRVVACLPRNSVVSITVLRGRELARSPLTREKQLLKQLREATRHKVELIQSIQYISDDGDTKGSPMETLTFYIGDVLSKSKMRFTLTREDVTELLATEKAPRDLWDKIAARAARLSRSAAKANRTRR